MAEGKVKSCADCLHNAVCSIWRENECQDASLYHENSECFYGWISVSERILPALRRNYGLKGQADVKHYLYRRNFTRWGKTPA